MGFGILTSLHSTSELGKRRLRERSVTRPADTPGQCQSSTPALPVDGLLSSGCAQQSHLETLLEHWPLAPLRF